jgi:hypothetical protein
MQTVLRGLHAATALDGRRLSASRVHDRKLAAQGQARLTRYSECSGMYVCNPAQAWLHCAAADLPGLLFRPSVLRNEDALHSTESAVLLRRQ